MNKELVEKITTQDSPTNQSIVINLSDINETNYLDYYKVIDKIDRQIEKVFEQSKEKFPLLIKENVKNGTDPLYNKLIEKLSVSKTANFGYMEVYVCYYDTYRKYLAIDNDSNFITIYVSVIAELANATFKNRRNLSRYDFQKK